MVERTFNKPKCISFYRLSLGFYGFKTKRTKNNRFHGEFLFIKYDVRTWPCMY